MFFVYATGVLFCVGGRGACGDPFRTIECYDLRQNRWFQVTDMSTRRRHVGVVAVGGRIQNPFVLSDLYCVFVVYACMRAHTHMHKHWPANFFP